MLLRDPIRFVWRYALGWKQPDEADEPLTLDALALGMLVHDVLRSAVERLEDAGRFAAADAAAIASAIGQALGEIATAWELEQPVPPAVIWRSTLARIRELSLTALHCPLDALPGQKSWTEIPFGTRRQDGTRSNLPWDVVTTVEIPGTGMTIQGHIDRLDLAGDGTRARVIDYKTGRLRNNMAQVVLDGGKELQRCLYAFAVKTLIGPRVKVEAVAALSQSRGGRAGAVSIARRRRGTCAACDRARNRAQEHDQRDRRAGRGCGRQVQRFCLRAAGEPQLRRSQERARARAARESGRDMGRGMKPLPDAAARCAALAAIDRSLLVEAGAGSGKTALMAGRVAVLFANGVEPKHVAAVTFTEFAASELLQRITRFAEALARGEVPSELGAAFPAGISAEQQAQVQRACNAIDQLTCTTIHGFAQKLIKPYPAEADMDPGAEIIDPAEADLAFEERYEAWLKAHLGGDDDDGVVAELVLADEQGALKLLDELAQFLRRNRDAKPAGGALVARSRRSICRRRQTQFADGLESLGTFEEEQTDAACRYFVETRRDAGTAHRFD